MDRDDRAREDVARPAKRPRLLPGLPDGFAPPPSHTNTSKRSVPTPVFHSDFASTGTARRGEGSRAVVVRPDFGGLVPKPSNNLKTNDTDTALAKRPPPSFSLSGASIAKPKPASDASLVRASALSLAFSSPAKGKEKAREETRERERESNTSRMLHNPPTTTTAHTSTHKTHGPLKPVPIPPPLALPRLHTTNTSSPSKMKTISTTRVALATDPRTESGSSELFSLFLRHQGGGGKREVGVYGDAVERELGRGLEVSPEKVRRGGGEGRGRFVRGGLAESFSRRFAENDTDQKLWEEYTARSYSHAESGKRVGKAKAKVKPDVKLKTIQLLHRTPLPQNALHPQHKSRAPVVTLARCLVLESPTGHSHSHSHTKEGEFGKGKEVTVLFRHNYSAFGMGMGKSSSVDIQLGEGIEVHVWRPWLELPSAASPSTGADVGVGASGPVWMCSRFHVVQGDGARASLGSRRFRFWTSEIEKRLRILQLTVWSFW